MKLEIHFDQQEWSGRTNIYITTIGPNGTHHVAAPMELKFNEVPESSAVVEPSLTFDRHLGREFFPALVDALARSGYKYESSDAGELKATKVHLDDMRNLALRLKP